MTDPLDRVLKLVAEGKLTAEEAAPLLEALDAKTKAGPAPAEAPMVEVDAEPGTGRTPRFARVEVREAGKRVVDLRVPISLGRFALSRIPGMSTQQLAEVEQAVMAGAHGPILEVEDTDGDGVRIVLE